MTRTPATRIMQRAVATVALVFGLMTVIAGGRIAVGLADPGYVVFRPLLLYNTAMGFAYLAAGVLLWRNLRQGRVAAGVIVVLNVMVLASIIAIFAGGGAVAPDSLRAMSLRTVVWLALFAAATYLHRLRSNRPAAALEG